MTDDWDAKNPEHKALAHQIELGNGIPEMRPLRLAREALKTVGFEIEHEEDLAARSDHVPWYYPLEGDISKAQTFWDYFTVWRMSWSGRLVSHNAMRVMEFVGLLPKGTFDVGESLKVAGEALVKGGQTKVRARCFARLFLQTDNTRLALYTNVVGCQPKTLKLRRGCGRCVDYIPIYLNPTHRPTTRVAECSPGIQSFSCTFQESPAWTMKSGTHEVPRQVPINMQNL
jgi:hypothetical protein